MSLVNFLESSKENKIGINFLNQLKPVRASKEILTIHRYCLNHLAQVKKKGQLMSPFSLFNQKPKSVNPLNITPAVPSELTDKISTLIQPTQVENPFQDFIKSLQGASKFEDPKLTSSSQFSAEIVGVFNQNKDFTTIRMKRPSDWQFLPGQYLEIRSDNLKGNKPAILAIASSISDEFIEITAKPNPNPSHANYCLNSKVGENLTITGPLGTNFPINLITDETPVLVLGGGSGLTAIKSVMESLPFGTDSKLIYSSKTHEELLYAEEIEKWKAIGHTISLTQDRVDGFEQGRITDHLAHMEMKPDTLVFICGPQELVLQSAKLLETMGVPRQSIFGSLPATAKDGGPVYRGDQPQMMIG